MSELNVPNFRINVYSLLNKYKQIFNRRNIMKSLFKLCYNSRQHFPEVILCRKIFDIFKGQRDFYFISGTVYLLTFSNVTGKRL